MLRSEATLKDPNQKDAALTALCDLYVVLRRDDRYSQSQMLQDDAIKIRRRLLSLASKKKGRLRHDKVPRPESLSSDVDTALAEAAKAVKAAADKESSSQSREQSQSKRQSLAAKGAQAGGADNGWQLVELIERVVAPDFWDTNGGSGSIHYFAMRRLLVVRATSDVHQQIRDLLLKLPR